MRVFTLLKDALVLGEKDEKYGYTLWASTDQGDVMFNSQTGSAVEGTQLTAEEAHDKVSKKGKPYLRLSKVKLVESQTAQVPLVAPRASADDIKTILELVRDNNDMLTRLLGDA